MEWIKQLAPLLGTAVGGPLGGVAASFIASKLGIEDSSVEKMNELLGSGSMSPDQVTSLRLAEVDFKRFLETNKIDLARVNLANVESARVMMTASKSPVPAILSGIIVLGFLAILILMLFGMIKVADSQALMILLTNLAVAFGIVINFWFGSSNGSQNKDALLAASKPAYADPQ